MAEHTDQERREAMTDDPTNPPAEATQPPDLQAAAEISEGIGATIDRKRRQALGKTQTDASPPKRAEITTGPPFPSLKRATAAHFASAAEKLFNALRDQHRAIELRADTQADFPAWFLLKPNGPVRIRQIGHAGPLMRFWGSNTDNDTNNYDLHLVPPDTVSIEILTLPTESDERRQPVVFIPHDPADIDVEKPAA
jgi:hypothetical protein